MRIRICFKVNGLSKDESGEPVPVGASIDLGEWNEEIEYEQLISRFNKEAIMAAGGPDKFVDPEDMVFITPEEYDRDFGD